MFDQCLVKSCEILDKKGCTVANTNQMITDLRVYSIKPRQFPQFCNSKLLQNCVHYLPSFYTPV